MSTYETMNAGRLFGVPIRLHYTAILFALVGVSLNGFRLVMALGSFVGYLTLVIAHELGHSAIGHLCGARTVEIVLYGWGGECRLAYTYESETALTKALVAWGGVLAQGVILVVTWLFVAQRWIPDSGFVTGLVSVFTFANVVMIALNLLPLGRLDGRAAWTLPLHLWRAMQARRIATRALRKATKTGPRRSQTKLRVIDGGRDSEHR